MKHNTRYVLRVNNYVKNKLIHENMCPCHKKVHNVHGTQTRNIMSNLTINSFFSNYFQARNFIKKK